MTATLRDFIARLRARNQLLVVEREVDPTFELNAVIRKVQGGPNLPVLFEKVRGCRYPVISNTLGNYGIIGDVLGVPKEGIAARWTELVASSEPVAGAHPATPDEYEEIPFADLPHLTFSEKDAGPYITAGVIIVRDPDTEVVNLSYHRMQMVGPAEMRCRLSTSGDLYRVQQKAEAMGAALPAVVAIGMPPAAMMAGAATVGPTTSEYELAARISGANFPMRMMHCGIPVPDSTEFLIEGEILPGERCSEGPFGEWMGYYTPPTDNHVFVVKRVLARRGAVFYAISAGSTEELAMSSVPIAGSVYNAIRTWARGVIDVTCFPLLQFCAVKMRDVQEGQPQRAMLAAFGAEMNRLLYCVVVDEDVDIHDWSDVLWAISSRCRPDRDIMQIPGVPSFARDPHKTHWGRLGIDATKPVAHAADFERKKTPMLESIRLEDYLAPSR